jgi:hypothetical protein
VNLGQIILSVQRQFGDTSGAQITVTDITRWANDAQIDIVRRTECLQIHAETNAIAADGSYYLPDDYVRLRRVTFDGVKLERVELEELDGIAGSREAGETTGSPGYFYVWGTRLWLYPAPASSGSGNLDIFYVKRPDTLENNSDIPEIPTHMHEDIVRFCLGRAKELDEEDGKAQEIMADYEARISLSRDETQNPEIDSYPSVRDIDGDYSGVYY